MKKAFILSCCIILACMFCNHRTQAQENTGSITVNSIPEKATITLNKTINGKAGEKFIDLEPGNYLVEVFIESLNLEIEILDQYLKLNVTLNANEEKIIYADFISNKIIELKTDTIPIQKGNLFDFEIDGFGDTIFNETEIPPKFPGGGNFSSYQRLICNNIELPDSFNKNVVYNLMISFVINKKGEIGNFKIKSGSVVYFDKAYPYAKPEVDSLMTYIIFDTILSMGDCTPAKNYGLPVNIKRFMSMKYSGRQKKWEKWEKY